MRAENGGDFGPGDHACHRADGCIGGDFEDIEGPGNGRINSALGSQNRNQQSNVVEQLQNVEDPDRKLRVKVTLEDGVNE